MLSEEEIEESLVSHEGRSSERLESLRTRGVSIDKPRPLEHHFWATSQRDAALLGRELYDRGFLILAMAPHDTGDGSQFWNLEAELLQAPADAGGRAVVEDLVRLAGSFDAIYDGWGTDMIPGRAVASLVLGLLLGTASAGPAGEPAEPSLAALDRAAVRFPREADTLLRRARALRDLGRLEPAGAEYRKALALAPSSGRHVQVGKELWDAGDRRAALAIWEAGLELDPADALLLRNLAYVRYAAGDFAAAVGLYRRVVEAAPDLLAARTDLGWALLGEGRFAEARAACEQVLERDPGNDAARAILSRLPCGVPAGRR